MADNFPLLFRNGLLRKHRRKILFEREKAGLPAFQIYVQHKKEYNALDEKIKELKKVFGNMYYGPGEPDDGCLNWKYQNLQELCNPLLVKKRFLSGKIDGLLDEKEECEKEGRAFPLESTERLEGLQQQKEELKKEIKPLKEKWAEIKPQWSKMRDEIIHLQNDKWRAEMRYEDRWIAGAATEADTKKEEAKEFIMKCPDDGCRGFLSSAYKCGTCSKWSCSKCMAVIGLEKSEDHVCDKDAVETAKMIKKETKPCPKCGTRIYKIDGCDMMWCVMDGCHTAFSWNTGKITTGTIHNPHYYEWMRRNGGGQMQRNLTDIPCGGIPNIWQMNNNIFQNKAIPAAAFNRIMNIHRRMVEHLDVRLPTFPARAPANANKETNVAYLMNKLDEDEWKRQLELTEARYKRKREVGQILSMAITAGSDILRRGLQQEGTHEEKAVSLVEVILPELDRLRDFVNDCFKALAKREHMAVPQLGTDWEWVPLRALYKSGASESTGSPKRKSARTTVDATASMAAVEEERNEIMLPIPIPIPI